MNRGVISRALKANEEDLAVWSGASAISSLSVILAAAVTVYASFQERQRFELRRIGETAEEFKCDDDEAGKRRPCAWRYLNL
jgi:hypothetical protein